MSWNRQFWVVAHDNHVKAEGPFNQEAHAEEIARQKAQANPGYAYVVCITRDAFIVDVPEVRHIERAPAFGDGL
jgi:hypothetical protein